MALLTVKQLTMQFGGLTAVRQLNLNVEPGQIVSLIGPNGAGKTTVFNVITGIYSATSGAITFAERDLRRPFTWRVPAACVLVALFTGAAGLLLAANVDTLWRVSIKNNNDEQVRFAPQAAATFAQRDTNGNGQWSAEESTAETQDEFSKLLRAADENADGELSRAEFLRGTRAPFSWAHARRDFARHLRGEPGLLKRGARWQIVSPLGNRPLASVRGYEQAEATRANLAECVRLRPTLASLVPQNERLVLLSEQTSAELLSFANEAEAESQLLALAEAASEQQLHWAREWLACAFGLAVGGAGAFVVWSRSRRTPDVIARGGLARTFQNIRLFQNMTVLENVLVGSDRAAGPNVLGLLFRTPRQRRLEGERLANAVQLLEFVGLTSQRHELAKNLAYGAQRRLEIARALATQPKLLLLDEPAAGMNPAESDELMHFIRKLRESGLTVLLIEHHMKLVMDISDRIAVLDYGEKIAEGTPAEVRANPRVIAAYLGQEEVS